MPLRSALPLPWCLSRVLWTCTILLLLPFAVTASSGQTVKTETCGGNHILPSGDINTDLEVNGITCVVDGTGSAGGVSGSYAYRNVNIWGGGTLQFQNAQVDFHAHSILVERDGTLTAGSGEPVKGPLTIWLYGSSTDGVPSITCKYDKVNQCGVPTDLWTSNKSVAMKMVPTKPCNPASKYGVTLPNDDCFYPYEIFDSGDKAGAYFGKKVLAVSAGGNLYLRGKKASRLGTIETDPGDSGTSWVRLVKDASPGDTTIYVDRLVPTWAPGDHIILTTTDYLPSHTEELVIKTVSAAVGADGNAGVAVTINPLAPPPMNKVRFPHSGTAYDYTSIAAQNPTAGPTPETSPNGLAKNHIETRAIVGVLSRSITVASEGATPTFARGTDHFPATPLNYYGGHVVFRDGFSTVQIQGVEFYELGQGGTIGRYPLHFHMARSVPQPNPAKDFLGTYIADSAIVDSMTRFVTVHATQGVTLARNVGYKSIGHGFYLEDATETMNRLYSNLAVSVRGAISDKESNPRLTPGILDLPVSQNPYGPTDGSPGIQMPDSPPYQTDVLTPSAFWIMNTWNDFEYNAVVGVNVCGACYWMPPAGISGPSRYETWKGYASMQANAGLYGATPVMTFKGNSCSASMGALITVGQTAQCNGVVNGVGDSTKSQLVSILNNNSPAVDDFPILEVPGAAPGQRAKATACDADSSNPQGVCNTVTPCSGFGLALVNCVPTVIDHFTTSFNWAPTNFAAMWLRGWWYLVQNTAITDSQNGGLTFVTGGGYTRSDAAQGFWSVIKNSILVGNTQPLQDGSPYPVNPFASNGGPFNPRGANCPYDPSHCIALPDDIVFVGSGFAVNQRLFNIYDGPAMQFSNIYADVHLTKLGQMSSCIGDGKTNQQCSGLGWFNAAPIGVLQNPPTNKPTNTCYLPNAAIAWKQPNGFYYPPAFTSHNLVFNNVDIRHFVIQPLFVAGTFNTDTAAAMKNYCTWANTMFNGYTDIDRQTELTDVDGTLTGLTSEGGDDPVSGKTRVNDDEAEVNDPTISVTKDPYFSAPLKTDECASGQQPGQETANDAGATVDTSPYEYATTAMIPECAANNHTCGGNWFQACSTEVCYGVPLYRQMVQTAGDAPPFIRMMGQGNGQRSTLSVNHGNYYVDTTATAAYQQSKIGPNISVFQAGEKYDFFFVFAQETLQQTYSLFIGKGLTTEAAQATIVPGRMTINNNSFPFATDPSGLWAKFSKYDPNSGVLTVTVDMSGQSDLKPDAREDFCQPKRYCSWDSTSNTCGCKSGSGCTDPNVCALGVGDLDCPLAGCYGFQITMPSAFTTSPTPLAPPKTVAYTSINYFVPGKVTFFNVSKDLAGTCRYDSPPMQQ